jgi:hypothetical protein
MQLDSVRNGEPPPSERHVAIVRDRLVGAGAERRRERKSNLSLEGIAGNLLQLRSDRVEALTLALADFDGEKLEQMLVPIGRTSAGAFGPIEQSARNVEPNRARAGSSAC